MPGRRTNSIYLTVDISNNSGRVETGLDRTLLGFNEMGFVSARLDARFSLGRMMGFNCDGDERERERQNGDSNSEFFVGFGANFGLT